MSQRQLPRLVTGCIDLPIWLPPTTGEMAGLHDGHVSATYAEGLRCRPVHTTVAGTWHWLQADRYPDPRDDRPPLHPASFAATSRELVPVLTSFQDAGLGF
jgi:hypothetical protein